MVSHSGPLSGFKKALVLAPHTDDELGCAGTMARLIESGCEIQYIAFSSCEESLPEGWAPGTLIGECRECVRRLGVPEENIQVLDYRVRLFPDARQSILELLYKLNQQSRPDLVLVPSSYDKHQDHSTIHNEALRAFKSSTILGYELPQNNISFENSAFVPLSEEHLATKIHAIAAYQSQAFRSYATPEYLRALALVRGVQCQVPLAEAFEAIKLVLF